MEVRKPVRGCWGRPWKVLPWHTQDPGEGGGGGEERGGGKEGDGGRRRSGIETHSSGDLRRENEKGRVQGRGSPCRWEAVGMLSICFAFIFPRHAPARVA